MLIGTKKNEALAAIEFALKQDDGWGALDFLRAWYEGNGNALQEWPEWLKHVATLEDDPEAVSDLEKAAAEVRASGFDADAVRAIMDRSGDEERAAEKAARAQGWTCGGDDDDIIYNTKHYESWKAAISWSPGDGPVYSSWTQCCEDEGIEYDPKSQCD
jgi:uncharacterized protein (UPF0335 family)